MEIVEAALSDGQPVTAAFVRDWPALALQDNLLYLTGGDTRLVAKQVLAAIAIC